MKGFFEWKHLLWLGVGGGGVVEGNYHITTVEQLHVGMDWVRGTPKSKGC